MIIVVSGYRRSGTSAMMACLDAALTGYEVLYQPEWEKIGSRPNDGYIPNPSGLWEVAQQNYMNAHFMRSIPDQSLLKVLYDGLPALPKRDYTVIYMHRDPDEIQASCERVDKHLRAVGVRENPKAWYPFDCFRPYRQADIDHVLGIMEARRDVRLEHVLFDQMINAPLEVFTRLSRSLPLDPTKAAAIIDSKHYRSRKINEDDTDRDAEGKNVHSLSDQ